MRGNGAVRTNPRSNGPSTQADPLLSTAHALGCRPWAGAAATSRSGTVATKSPTNSPNGSNPDTSRRSTRVPPYLRHHEPRNRGSGAWILPATGGRPTERG
ncbi:hypothetical protein FMUBM48_39470 [Nocardia cyriacigeorgica]|nr:hypothetical protein FMUBM48_39470 [Nocardia cyriacigeorgica]